VTNAWSGPASVIFMRTVKRLPGATWRGAEIDTLLSGAGPCAEAPAGQNPTSAPMQTTVTVRMRSR
jgi:hypothetical protein